MVANRNIMENVFLDVLGLGKVSSMAPHWESNLLYLSNWRQRIAWNEEYDETTKDWQVYSEFYLTNLEKDVSVGRWKGGTVQENSHGRTDERSRGTKNWTGQPTEQSLKLKFHHSFSWWS